MKKCPDKRFADRVEVASDGCWNWTGTLDRDGYARMYTTENSKVLAHRWIYERRIAPIPAGLHIDHLCRNRRCVNPAHLEPVTPRVNALRGDTHSARNFAKTHCDDGHPLSGSNLYLDSRGWRGCKVCRCAAVARYTARKKAA